MKILLTGGTGFIGSNITSRLVQDGHEVTILTRAMEVSEIAKSGVTYQKGDPTQPGPWQRAIRNQDVIINLTGASIFSKWTDEHKKAIRESRILTTHNIVAGIESSSERKLTLISSSAVGYYGFRGDEELTEESPPGTDFLAQIAVDWEAEALKATEKGARVVIIRFGIVLGKNGGALTQMVSLFKKYIGGPIGSGNQWFSWVHIRDLTEAFAFLLKQTQVSGPVNLCSPKPVRNKDLAKALGEALQRPSFMPAPGFMIKLVLGEFGSFILEGQRVMPGRLLDSGFEFQYAKIDNALDSLVSR